jgi:hypothetical protein
MWFSKPCLKVFVLALYGSVAVVPGPAQPTFCNSGVHADAFLSFAQAPPPQQLPLGGGMSSAVSFVLPVQNVSGMSATVAIPGMEVIGGTAYSASNDTLILNGATNTSNPGDTTFSITLSQPVKGVSLNFMDLEGANSPTHTFDLAALTTDGRTLHSSASGSYPQTVEHGYYSVPLQIATLGRSIQQVKVTLTTNSAPFVNFGVSNVRIETGQGPDLSKAVPSTGLQLWLRADQVGGDYGSGVPSWHDSSGHGHDATQTVAANQPQLAFAGPNCQPTLAFGQSGIRQSPSAPLVPPAQSFLNFTLPIGGWDEMTIFLLAQSHTDPSDYPSFNSAIFWVENALWGNTFLTPFQTHVDFRFGTTQVNNNEVYERPTTPGIGQQTAGADFQLTTALHNDSVDMLYVNGTLVLSQGGKLATLSGSTGAGTIGKGINDSYFNGEISEILVYDRVLEPAERERVENYLKAKYGLN